jgi:hypothetical protein
MLMHDVGVESGQDCVRSRSRQRCAPTNTNNSEHVLRVHYGKCDRCGGDFSKGEHSQCVKSVLPKDQPEPMTAEQRSRHELSRNNLFKGNGSDDFKWQKKLYTDMLWPDAETAPSSGVFLFLLAIRIFLSSVATDYSSQLMMSCRSIQPSVYRKLSSKYSST